MREKGWCDKDNVQILQGKWQDFVESEELLAVGGFDVIYTDTFSEDYARTYITIFVTRHAVLSILAWSGRIATVLRTRTRSPSGTRVPVRIFQWTWCYQCVLRVTLLLRRHSLSALFFRRTLLRRVLPRSGTTPLRGGRGRGLERRGRVRWRR